MTDIDLALVRRSMTDDTHEEFRQRVHKQAAFLREELATGSLDNPDFALGLELEAYVVDSDGRLARVPDGVFDVCEKELGLHNIEVNTEATPFDAAGIRAQADGVREGVKAARDACREEGIHLVLDGMWTIPPPEGSKAYLAAGDQRDGIRIARNMRPVERYVALDNEVLATAGTVEFAVPGARHELPSILVESLATSIQPHLQIPTVEEFPAYYNAAIRTLGPVLALSTNAPFLPFDLYAEVQDPRALVAATHHELRIAAFEQPMNAGPGEKVRFPRDIDSTPAVIDHILDDAVYAPFLGEWNGTGDGDDRAGTDSAYADQFPEFDHKRGTYWRWLRPVIGGESVGTGDQRSLRIEYRALPTQPTVIDNVALQVLVAGLVRGLVAADHPLEDLPWTAAKRCFYDVVERGLDADIAWIRADGEPATDTARIYDEIFALARRGLHEAGVPERAADEYLTPIEQRWDRHRVPSGWKKRQVSDRLDAGEDLMIAIEGMQHEYIRRAETGEPFVEW